MLWFLVGCALEDQLDKVAVALRISTFGLSTRGGATDQTHILDLVREAILDKRIMLVDEGWDALLAPHEMPRVALLWPLEHEAYPRIVALTFDTVQTAPTALEADGPGCAQADTIDRLIGTGG